MFKNILLTTVAASILFTSFDGLASPRRDSSDEEPASRRGQIALNLAIPEIQFSDKTTEDYRAVISSGNLYLDVGTVSQMLAGRYQELERYTTNRESKMREELNDLRNGLPVDESVCPGKMSSITRQNLIRYFLGKAIDPSSESTLSPISERGEDYYRQILMDPNMLLSHLLVKVKVLKYRVDSVRPILNSVIYKLTNASFMNFCLEDESSEDNHIRYVHTIDGIQVLSAENEAMYFWLLFIKSLSPFLSVLSHISHNHENIAEYLKSEIESIEIIYETQNLMFHAIRSQQNLFNELTMDGVKPLDANIQNLYQDQLVIARKNHNKNASIVAQKGAAFYQHQDLEMKGVVSTWRQKVEEKKRLEKEQRKEKSHQKLVATIKETVAAREAEALRLQAEKTAMSSSSSTSTIATSKKSASPRDPSADGQYIQWYVESKDSFNARKETQQKLATLVATQKRKADAKDSKNHEIDPERAQSSSSSSSATSSSSCSSTSTVSAPAAGEIQPRATLGSNHYKTFESLLTDKDSCMDVAPVQALFEALGGYVDNSHEGSRVGMGLRHIDSGQAVVRIIHDHAKNGRKGLRPEQILEIREMLGNAGFTFDTVISR